MVAHRACPRRIMAAVAILQSQLAAASTSAVGSWYRHIHCHRLLRDRVPT
ncbi:hypothetical protein QJS66_06140 [Kocuria rhizophila]|nr:hypothetical protein QJS66_06140 [Kocuria rhizophila]